MHTELWGIPLIYYFVVLTMLLNRIPVVGKYFNLINTILHEFGHALIAILFQGEVYKIEIFGDTSGTTTTKMKSKFGNILVALGGYPFASAAALLSFHLLNLNYAKPYIIGLSLLFFIIMILFIRNKYGWFWTLSFCALNATLIYCGTEQYIDIAALFYATAITTESVASAFTLLCLSVKDSQKAGDATNLKKFTHIPAFLWALIFFGFSIFICHTIYNKFFVIFAD